MSEIILETKALTKSYSGIVALKSFDLQVRKGEIHALVGENGAGKSTLIQALVGAHKPDSGDIILNGNKVEFDSPVDANNIGISAVFQELSVVNNLSVAENIFINRQPTKHGFVDYKKMNSDAAELMKEFGLEGVAPDTLVGELSPANKQLVEIVKAVSYHPQILILDEPTSSLTEVEAQILFKNLRKLKEQGISQIYISHHLREIFELTDSLTIMRDGEKVCDAVTAEVDEKFLMSKMVGRELGSIYGSRGNEPISEKCVLEVKNLSRAGKFKDVSFHINEGEIVAFAGLVGAGRTEVGLSVFGVDTFDEGEILLEDMPFKSECTADSIAKGVGYVSEDRKQEGLFLRHSINMNLSSNKLDRFTKKGFINGKELSANGEYMRESFRIVCADIEQPVSSLSGGNQQKVLLANWFDINPKLLIIDEPTRGVDVGAKSEIYAKIRELARKGTATMLISSDLTEVLGMADRIYVMREGTISGELSAAEASEKAVLSLALASVE